MRRLLLALALGSALACGEGSQGVGSTSSSEGPPAGLTETEWGGRLFSTHGCPGCHAPRSHSVGSPIASFFESPRPLVDGTEVVADRAYLERSILDPNAQVVRGYPPVMPPYDGLLEEREVNAIIVFLEAQH